MGGGVAILEWSIVKYGGKVWTEFMWFGPVACSCEHSELSLAIKGGKFFSS
jgi:hypothetical protein